MNRRELLLRVGAVGTVAVSGCLGSQSRDQLAVEGAAPTLSPGEDAVIVATVSNADRVSFSRLPDGQIEATDTDVSPSPDRQFDSFPPGWVWDNPQPSIEATLSVSTASDAQTSEYDYGLNAANGSKEVTAQFNITVDSNDS
jgi:hypothetical protein